MQLGLVDTSSHYFFFEKLFVASKLWHESFGSLSSRMTNLVPVRLKELQPVAPKQQGATLPEATNRTACHT